MLKIKNPRAIANSAALDRTLNRVATDYPAAERRPVVIAALKEALDAGRGEIENRCDAGVPGQELARAQSYLLDKILKCLYEFTARHMYNVANPTKSERIAVLAVGGYGRAELAPYSDIDLLFLLPYKQTPLGEQITEYMLYVLWDLGLKVGHAVRSVDESLRQAKSDLTICTSLLESRHIAGDKRLYRTLMRRFDREIVAGRGPDFVEDKLAERDARHARMGDSRYVVEPNLKDGKGGLRDLHTLYWIGKFLYRVNDVSQLIEKGVLKRSEYRKFEKAARFLWTVRFHLHYMTGRAEERLTFDVQRALAARLGYGDRQGTQGVERFMKHYFLVAKDVGDLTRIFCAQLEAQHKRKPLLRLPRFGLKSRDVDGFRLDGDRLNVTRADDFKRDPVKILKLFHVAQSKELDIHPEALRLVTQNLGRVDAKLRRNPEANRIFLEILTSQKNPEEALTRMNEAGVFGRFIPDFGRIVAQMQYDMYHHYTVDEHTIRAIGILSKIDRGELADDHPLSTEIIQKLISRRVLYVALLLHDIAKGRGGNHSEIGEKIALELCPRLGLSGAETDMVAWLVRHHLLMSNVAQKRDIMDPKTVEDFADIVQSPERLRLLVVLTVADIRATGPTIWNGWKGQLLRELYFRAQEVLSGEAVEPSTARIAAAKEALRARLKDWSDVEFDAYCERHYSTYWLSADAAVHERDARMIAAAEAEGESLTVASHVDFFRDVTEIVVFTDDHPGLFMRTAGALSVAGASIVDARIYTTKDGKALDSFWVQDAEESEVSDPDKLKKIPDVIRRTFMGELRPRRILARKPPFYRRTRVFKVQPLVLIDNKASDTRTVIEIQGRDRPGLLFDLTCTLFDLNLSVSSAHIATYGERAVDVFYVRDLFGHKIEHPTKIKRIEERLTEAVTPPAAEKEREPEVATIS